MTFAGLHRSATEELTDWAPSTACQASLRADYLAAAGSGPEALRRDGGPSHLTASCLVFDESAEHVLLTLHRKAGLWMQFGGHLEQKDESLAEAALREAREESGIESVRLLPGIWRLDRHALGARFGTCREHLDVGFVGTVSTNSAVRVSDESIDVAWFPAHDLPADTVADLPPRIPLAKSLLMSAGNSHRPPPAATPPRS